MVYRVYCTSDTLVCGKVYGNGTNCETVIGTNEEESDERVYMGLKAEWYCQRCGTVVTKATPTSTDFPQGCSTCRNNTYLCDKNVGVLVGMWPSGPRESHTSYCNARIFHTESKGTPFTIDTAAGTMEVTIPQVPGAPTFPHGTVVYKLFARCVKTLATQLGRGKLSGTVAGNVDRDRPEVVVVTPSQPGLHYFTCAVTMGRGRLPILPYDIRSMIGKRVYEQTMTIENPQFGVLYTDEIIDTFVSQN